MDFGKCLETIGEVARIGRTVLEAVNKVTDSLSDLTEKKDEDLKFVCSVSREDNGTTTICETWEKPNGERVFRRVSFF